MFLLTNENVPLINTITLILKYYDAYKAAGPIVCLLLQTKFKMQVYSTQVSRQSQLRTFMSTCQDVPPHFLSKAFPGIHACVDS